MITTTSGNSPFAADCLNTNQEITNKIWQKNGNTSDTVMQKLDDWAGIDPTNTLPESQTQVKS